MEVVERTEQRLRNEAMRSASFGSKLASYFHLAHSSSTTARLPNSQTFAVTHLHSRTGLPDRTLKVDPDPALHVSVALAPMAKGIYRLWVSGKEIAVPFIPRFGMSIVDLEASPAATCTGPFDYLHFYVPREGLNDIADDLGVRPIGGLSAAILEIDPFVTQLTKLFLPHLANGSWPDPLTMDYLALLMGSHILERYAKFFSRRSEQRGGLSPTQRRRAEELLREHLDGQITLATVAQHCELSVSHFARAFKASVGLSVHRWLTHQRLNHSKDLLLCTSLPLADVGLRSGFSDQSAFTRAFARATGLSPGRWRKRHKERA